ncbi:hypothetical protein Adeg_2169 (plasmid) [Ammonifex degensii KC4]|uniref:Uncharacterized protein n=1 Tax=Ammonifex degensii (strain DSM 10501 / KC4) TaxID=429009 RepID=C9RDH5_AMMDK|nr:hypothetical protein Adeg_2169 [Ammonifex degensii KC4]
MEGKRISLSPLLLVFLGLLLSAAGGFLAGDFVSHISDVEIRFGWWWKLSGLGFFLASHYVSEFLLPVESLPIKNLAGPPRSRVEFLKHIALAKQVLFVCALMLPGLTISIVVGGVPAVSAVSCLPAMVTVALMACTWGTAVDLNPTFAEKAWGCVLIIGGLGIVFLSGMLILIFTLAIPEVGNFVCETEAGNAILLSLLMGAGFLYFLEVSYRSLRKSLAETNDQQRLGGI